MLFYATPTWARPAMKFDINRKQVTRSLRTAAIRIINAYRTVSTEAALFLAKTPPGDLLALEKVKIHERANDPNRTETLIDIRSSERKITMQGWKASWSRGGNAAWTRRLLPNLDWWLASPKYLNFHMTQALSGHGCFRYYLYKRKRALTETCLYCNHP